MVSIKKDLIYQDCWIDGKIEQKGSRECKNRYISIKNNINKLNIGKNFYVLDIGSNLGYFSFRFAYDFDCNVIMLENHLNESKEFDTKVRNLCKKQKNNFKISLIRQYLTEKDFKKFYDNNITFDVVLALRVIHHHEDPLNELKLLNKISKYIFLQLPNKTEPKKLNHSERRLHNVAKYFQNHKEFLKDFDYEKLGDFYINNKRSGKKSPMYLIKNENIKIKKYDNFTETLKNFSIQNNLNFEYPVL